MLIQEGCGDPYEYYDETKLLGEGSFGKVFKVKHKISRVFRAMKIINKNLTSMSIEDVEALINEINILKSLDHPNIIKVYEYFNTKRKLFIINELCTGGELFDKISQEKHFNEKVSAHVMRQLMSAVQFCHANGIIHRDLKPENILIESEEEARKEYFTIKVIDFGTSDKLKINKMLVKQIGTPFYIAPEVLNNSYN
jgi:calcium-dependent protein kinase